MRAIAARRAVAVLALAWLLAAGGDAGLARDAPAAAAPRFDLSPDVNPVDVLHDEIAASQHTVDAVVYKFDAKPLRKALHDALERGLAVRIVADEEASEGDKSDLRRIARHGAKVRLWKKEKLHAKFVTLDGRRVVTGSFNWTKSADDHNVELLIRYDDPAVAARFSELFQRLWEEAEPFDPQ
jgi:mitochondrial cardiolipin hydrolase